MNDLKTFATFETTIMGDADYFFDDENETPGGESTLRAVLEHFITLGFEENHFGQRSFYGWEFLTKRKKIKFHSVIQWPGVWLLIVEPKKQLLPFGKPSLDDYEKCFVELRSLISRDPRFQNVKWFTRTEYENNLQ